MKLLFILLLPIILHSQVIKDTVDQCYSVTLVDVSEDSLQNYLDYYQVDAAMNDTSRNILDSLQMQYYHLIAREKRTIWLWTYYVTVWEGDIALAILVSDTTCLKELTDWPLMPVNLRIVR